MKEQFKSAFEIQRDGSKQVLAAMVTYSEANSNSYKHVISRYQHVINELDEIVKLIGAKP
jgi:hypothetical protein